MSKIINPNGYQIEVKILFDPVTGQSELQCKNHRPDQPVEMIKLAGLLCHHGSTLLNSCLSGTTKVEPLKKDGEENATQKAN